MRMSLTVFLVLFFTLLCGNVLGKSYKCGNVSDGFDYSLGSYGGECVIYVRNETGIERECCSGSAKNCFAQAQGCGYNTGSMPTVGSIMVMDGWSTNTAGHVAIVIELDSNNPSLVKVRDSNWSSSFDKIVREHWIDTSAYTIKGYIYCDGDAIGAIINEPDAQGEAWARSGNLAWQPIGVACQDASKWVDLGNSSIVADRTTQCIDGVALCENYGVYPVCKID